MNLAKLAGFVISLLARLADCKQAAAMDIPATPNPELNEIACSSALQNEVCVNTQPHCKDCQVLANQVAALQSEMETLNKALSVDVAHITCDNTIPWDNKTSGSDGAHHHLSDPALRFHIREKRSHGPPAPLP